MSIPFLRSHAAPQCALEGTCACSAPLHEGGGGVLSLFIALRSCTSAGLAPPCGGWGANGGAYYTPQVPQGSGN